MTRPTDQALVASPSSQQAVSTEGFDPSRDEECGFYEHEDDCANCGGEGFTYGCSWDWQCGTWDEGEMSCLCTRPCDWCRPSKPDPKLQAILADALASGMDTATADETAGLGPKGDSPTAASGDAQTETPEGTRGRQ